MFVNFHIETVLSILVFLDVLSLVLLYLLNVILLSFPMKNDRLKVYHTIMSLILKPFAPGTFLTYLILDR